ncbi:hypothetical protein [Sediminicola luteus]|uniref:Uncharacterized protein n=1 Tax=Sediminicola luteus TaxID=319238 RepID=A0A2A4G7J8_9FLAO|nr:hypothetical protein [Sediminicola luteus]PCE63966.1 hypothetical protein B7P33_11980 [Sediminicola luteus]
MAENPFKKDDFKKAIKSRSIWIGSIVAVLIAISPYLFYTYQYFPNTPTYDTFLFSIESTYYESVNTMMWMLMGKLIPLILLILWFFTCKHWWYHIILIPVAMYAFQIFSLIESDIKNIDEIEIYWLIPIMMFITPFVYFIRVKLFDKHVLGIDLDAMDQELKELKAKQKASEDKNMPKAV